ncbi:MAG: dipeptide/oligopeptide/nickel ABC transporter ATP-binding protein [Bifidobacteriaceae bacterium]|jgi:ABC-type glutathione transport system ATPase component|nr:dipeptide/oligopeptide/nickel ABC transporter ATP-binding protein [Bifidobacteriaceae bacterium]
MADAPLLEVNDLSLDYGRGKSLFRALDHVSLEIHRGECLGLVGESGSGKSTLGKAILGLAQSVGGEIVFDGREIQRLPPPMRRRLAKDLQVIFQDPYGSLSPAMTIGRILAEPLRVGGMRYEQAKTAVGEMLERVSLPREWIDRYPSEFSGGQRQRIAIARALIRQPRLIVCDEPVSALDVTTQSTIIDLLIELQRETGVAYLFISHDLAVVRRICHRVAVLFKGQIVEQGGGEKMTTNPDHPYSKRLLMASPVADPTEQARRREAWLQVRTGQA